MDLLKQSTSFDPGQLASGYTFLDPFFFFPFLFSVCKL